MSAMDHVNCPARLKKLFGTVDDCITTLSKTATLPMLRQRQLCFAVSDVHGRLTQCRFHYVQPGTDQQEP